QTRNKNSKKKGVKADRPDYKVVIADRESSFGEFTGPAQQNSKAKIGWDLYRLSRFGQCVLDEGTPMVPLIQVISGQGTMYRHIVKTRGIMVLVDSDSHREPVHRGEDDSLWIGAVNGVKISPP
ncbi:hypothetical protein BGX27_006138, partial [Mortierella sp. AM989]